MIRQPIVSVLGHVDHGKTLLLDQIRGTFIAEKEAGKITQHIGATEIPFEIINNTSGELLKKFKFNIELPGLLFIDTPGHEAFSSLRKRGGNIADIAVLVVDITQGFQPQTIEAINILKDSKTPFVVAANKIDKIFGWQSKKGSFLSNLENQGNQEKQEVDNKIYEIVGMIYDNVQINSERFDRCEDYTKQIPIIPCSAMTGEGIPELLMMLSGLSQKFLKGKLEITENEKPEGTILEIREEQGLGTTIDVILYKGTLKTGNEIVLGGKHGTIKTKIKALLKPKPLQETKQKNINFNSVKEVNAASGVKISAPGLDDALAGSPVLGIIDGNEENEIETELENTFIQNDVAGVIIKADTLGSLEAMINLLKKENVPIKKADVGNVSKKDVMETLTVEEKDEIRAVIFAFNTGIEKNAEEELKKRNLKIFNGNVVYKLIEDYLDWVKEKQNAQKNAKEKELIYPFKLRILKGFVFRNSEPAVVGVKVLEGKLKKGIKVISEKGKLLGKIEGIQSNGKEVDKASKGEEIAASFSKGVVDRNLFEGDIVYPIIPLTQVNDIKQFLGINSEEEEILSEIIKIKSREE